MNRAISKDKPDFQPLNSIARLFALSLRLVGRLSKGVDHKGLWHTAKYLGQMLPPSQMCTVAVGQESRFAFPLGDPYWARLLAPSYAYEPEIEQVLLGIRDKPFLFLDCGANFGYWSVFCTDSKIGCEKVVAIEASSENFRFLKQNCDVNGGRFEILNRAIFSISDMTVHVSQRGQNHAGASISNSGLAVRTIIIDDLVAEKSSSSQQPIVLKLDVEGVEIEALKGAGSVMDRDALIIYEDHGKDPESKVTDFVLGKLSLQVYFIDNHGRIARIKSAAEASRRKHRPKGYNFFAVTKGSSFSRYFDAASL